MRVLLGPDPDAKLRGGDEVAGLNSSDDPWQERIAHWLDDLGLGAGLELTMQPLGGGAQNDLWSLDRGDIELVLRRPPLESTPDRLATFEREQTLLRALVDTDVPHAKLVGSGYDEVLGVPFFVMERVDGWSPTGLGAWPPPFHEDLEARRGLAFELVGGAAMLANVDWRDRGLADFGHPDGFHDRQVDRWLTFYSRFRFRELPGIDAAAAWLRRNRPAHWTPGVMHGDYQFANVLFAHGAPAKLAAIIDWEMATIGDPLLDLGWALMAWGPEADDMPHARYMAMEGMPSRDQLLEHYVTLSGRSIESVDYYVVLARFKLAIVLEKSVAAAARGGRTHDGIRTMDQLAVELMQKAGSLAQSKSS